MSHCKEASIGIPIIKIRGSHIPYIFIMGNLIPEKTVLDLSGPWCHITRLHSCLGPGSTAIYFGTKTTVLFICTKANSSIVEWLLCQAKRHRLLHSQPCGHESVDGVQDMASDWLANTTVCVICWSEYRLGDYYSCSGCWISCNALHAHVTNVNSHKFCKDLWQFCVICLLWQENRLLLKLCKENVKWSPKDKASGSMGFMGP